MKRAVVVTLLAAAMALRSEPEASPAAAEAPAATEPVVKELDGDRLQVGEVVFNRKTREIRFPARVNMNNDELLEFAVVHENGKTHESLLATSISATHLNLAFKLLRYPASPEFFSIVGEDGSTPLPPPDPPAEVKAGARLDILVEWKDADETRSVKLNEWISHVTTGQSMPADPWVYGGSGFNEGRFLAETSGDLIAIYLSNSSLVNYSGEDHDSDEVWVAFPKRVPPVGTAVNVIIRPHPRKPTDPP